MRCAGANQPNTIGAENRPAKMVSRQAICPERGASKPPTMLLMPRIRPLNKIKTAEPMPRMMPPASESHGVKCVQSMVMGVVVCGLCESGFVGTAGPLSIFPVQAEFVANFSAFEGEL